MDTKFFEEQFSALKNHIDVRFDRIEHRIGDVEKRMDGLEKRMDGFEKRMDGLEKRMETTEKFINRMGIEIEAIRADMRLVAEGHMMLTEKFGRFETEYIRHAIEMRQDVLNLYKLTYGQLERRVKDLENTVKNI
ncbi:MAG: hypothetical protein WA126_08455 [Thermodesulfovibrionales bacterium]